MILFALFLAQPSPVPMPKLMLPVDQSTDKRFEFRGETNTKLLKETVTFELQTKNGKSWLELVRPGTESPYFRWVDLVISDDPDAKPIRIMVMAREACSDCLPTSPGTDPDGGGGGGVDPLDPPPRPMHHPAVPLSATPDAGP